MAQLTVESRLVEPRFAQLTAKQVAVDDSAREASVMYEQAEKLNDEMKAAQLKLAEDRALLEQETERVLLPPTPRLSCHHHRRQHYRRRFCHRFFRERHADASLQRDDCISLIILLRQYLALVYSEMTAYH